MSYARFLFYEPITTIYKCNHKSYTITKRASQNVFRFILKATHAWLVLNTLSDFRNEKERINSCI